jgi:voltage-gated potassium channel
MAEPLDGVTTPDDGRQARGDRLAGPMFLLSVLFLVVLAGALYRYPNLDPDGAEAYVIEGGLAALWLVFLLESAYRFGLRDRSRPAWKPLASAVARGLVPPVRMGCRSLTRPDHVWLPRLGWQKADAHLRRTLERFFSVPMVFFALMVLPLFVVEHYWKEEVVANPYLALGVAVGTSVIWLAFAVELIVMASVDDRPARYCVRHWIDVAIVLLPLVEVMPLFRLFRLGRVLRLEELLRWGRLHRLQSLALRGWRALFLLQIVQRLTGRSPERHLRQLQELLRAKQEEVADLRQEIEELGKRIAKQAADRKAARAAEEQPVP